MQNNTYCMRHLRTANIGRVFTRYSVYGTIVVCQFVSRSLCHGCIVVKRFCEIGPRLLMTTNRKSHISFQMT